MRCTIISYPISFHVTSWLCWCINLKHFLIEQWTCTIGSITNFGAECGLFKTSSGSITALSDSAITIKANSIKLDITYSFGIVVSAPDGRSAAQIVTVSAVDSGSAITTIRSTFVKFNPGSTLTISANLLASYAVTTQWSVRSSSGVTVPFTALTPMSQQISAANAANSIAFPLSISANTFPAGSVFSFRLTVERVGNTNPIRQTFTEIMLTANSVPTGGIVSSYPTAGAALVTSFVISTSGWATAAENFPLNFAFAYQDSFTLSFLTITALSLRAFVAATLPAGLVSQSYLILLQGQAIDIFSSSSSATSSVTVKRSANLNITNLLTVNLASGFSTGNVNLVFQTINNVSHSFSSSNRIFNFVFPLILHPSY
jgi:hypothetical protein